MNNKKTSRLGALRHFFVDLWERPPISDISAVAIVVFAIVIFQLAAAVGDLPTVEQDAGAQTMPTVSASGQTVLPEASDKPTDRHEAKASATDAERARPSKIAEWIGYAIIVGLMALLWVVGLAALFEREVLPRLAEWVAQRPGLTTLLKLTAGPFALMARICAFTLSVIDWVLVRGVAVAAGTTIRGWVTRYAVLAAWILCSFMIATTPIFPINLGGVAVGFVIVLSVARRWQWLEGDRLIFAQNARSKLFRLLAPEDFNQDLRDEALIGLSATFFLAAAALNVIENQLQGFVLADGGDFGFLSWLGFVGGELAKAVPFVDWSEVYKIENGSLISANDPSAKHTVFAMRVFFDLLLLAAVAQGVELMGRLATQRRLFKDRELPILDPFLEREEFRKARTPEQLVSFPFYDPARLDRIQVRHFDEEMRWRATAFLIVQGNLAAIMLAAQQEEDPLDYRTFQRAMKRIKGGSAVAKLTAFLENDRNPATRAGAARTLAFIQAEGVIEQLGEAMLNDDAVEVRIAATEALGELQHFSATADLRRALSVDAIRRDAIYALGQMGDQRLVEPLVALLADTSTSLRVAALWALGSIQSLDAVAPIRACLVGGPAAVRAAAVRALRILDDVGSAEAIRELLVDNEDEVRSAAFLAMQHFDPPNHLERAIQAARDPFWLLRWDAAQALARKPDGRCLDALLHLLKDNVTGVRRIAIRGLRKLGDSRALEPLIVCLQNANELPHIRDAAAEALGHFGDAKAIEPLLKRLKEDIGDDDRLTCAQSLQVLGYKKVHRLYRGLASADSPWARIGAVSALVDMKAPSSARLVRRLLSDVAPEARAEACDLVATLEGPKAYVDLLRARLDTDTWGTVRWSAVRNLVGILGREALPDVLKVAEDLDEFVRIFALRQLSEWKHPHALSLLIEATCDEDEDVCRAAADLLDAFDDPRAKEALRRLLESENRDLVAVAALSLAGLGDTAGIAALANQLTSERTSVRVTAAGFLGATKSERAIGPLQRAAEHDTAPRVRSAAARAIKAITAERQELDLQEPKSDARKLPHQRVADESIRRWLRLDLLPDRFRQVGGPTEPRL